MTPTPGSPTPPRLEALVRTGTGAAMRGDLRAAAAAFEEAAGVARKARRADDELRCLLLLAQTHRLLTDTETALAVVARARRLARPGNPLRPAVLAEQAEIALAANDGAAGAALLDEAAALADRQMAPRHRRRLAAVRAALGEGDAADAAFVAAIEGFEAVSQPKNAAETAVERATAAVNLRLPGRLDILENARARASHPMNVPALGQLDMLEAAAVTNDGRIADAEPLLRAAREKALAGVDPVLYSGASFALADVADLRGDRIAAYDAIASGWATLGDLLGAETAVSVFRPKLEAFEVAWGTEAFVSVKEAWETQRRDAKAAAAD